MLKFLNIVALFLRFCHAEVEASNTSSPVLFTLVGQAALKTAYGHLIVPLNLPSIKTNFDQFDDLENTINKLTTTTNLMYEHKNTELDNLRGKLDIIHHLTLTKAKESHFDKLDQENDFDLFLPAVAVLQPQSAFFKIAI